MHHFYAHLFNAKILQRGNTRQEEKKPPIPVNNTLHLTPYYTITIHQPKNPILITAPILPTGLPPLRPLTTIKHRLPQLAINIIMRPAKPLSKVVAALNPRHLTRDVRLKVLSAGPARV